jgi:hypothetical protein
MGLVVEMPALLTMQAMDLPVEIPLDMVSDAPHQVLVVSVLRFLQPVGLHPNPVPGDLALDSAKGIQLSDEVVDAFAEDVVAVDNDVGVWVVAFCSVHASIVGGSVHDERVGICDMGLRLGDQVVPIVLVLIAATAAAVHLLLVPKARFQIDNPLQQ